MLRFGAGVIFSAFCFFPVSDDILKWFKGLTGVFLAGFGVADGFFAVVKISLAAGLITVLPYLFYHIIRLVQKRSTKMTGHLWTISLLGLSMVLFFSGSWFCIAVTLKYGARFLLSYESNLIEAVISVRQFVSFCLALIFGFGLMFELPLVMMLLSRMGFVTAMQLARYRKYAILIITVISAVITPTPDIINLLLLSCPLYLLFELSLLGMRIIEKR